ncbi:MAG: response regulator [Chloroflexi bacterium]|nr:MAG: response regulator [Chloroflexota bacterium]
MKKDFLEILLVEDNEDDVIMTMEAFANARISNDIHVVKDGDEAMSYLLQKGKYKDEAYPALILLDINLPKKNGMELLQEIKADSSLRHIPIIMLTTSDREEDVVRSFSNGACSYITKPVGFSDFVDVAQKFSLYWALVTHTP